MCVMVLFLLTNIFQFLDNAYFNIETVDFYYPITFVLHFVYAYL